MLKGVMKMGYKEDALDFLGITEWHKAGYTGKGIKILSDEKVTEKVHPDVISPTGFKSKRGHGDDVMLHIKLVAPDAEFIAYPLTGTYSDKTYKSKSVEYIIENKVHIFTTSCVGEYPNGGKQKAIQDCIEAGCIFFASAGNDNTKGLKSEVKYEGYWAIGGVRPKFNGEYNGEEPIYDWNDLQKVSYSSVGPELDFVTLAEIIGPAGTSFCSPVFAAMIGLAQQFFIEKTGRRLTRNEMEKFIHDNLTDTHTEGFDIETGHGLLILPEPSSINVSDYVSDNTYIDYSGFPIIPEEKEEMKIQQMLLTPSKYTRPQTKIKPTTLAWHYVGNPNTTAIANRNYFESLKDSHKTKASSHYIVGLEGEIIQCIPDDEMSFCANDANDYTISIECCHPDSTGKYTDATYKAMIWLGKYLMAKHGIKGNIRHYDVTGKRCPKWFVDNPNEWEKFKEELEEEDMVRYKTVEEMPEYYRKDIRELIDRGIIAGRGGEAGLDLSDDMCRMAIYAKKIFEIGAK